MKALLAVNIFLFLVCILILPFLALLPEYDALSPDALSPNLKPEAAHESESEDNSVKGQIKAAMDTYNPIVRTYTLSLISDLRGDPYAQILRIFQHVNDNWTRREDVGGEHFSRASETIRDGFIGDCDDYAIVVASMLRSVEFQSRVSCGFDLNSGHAWPEVRILSKERFRAALRNWGGSEFYYTSDQTGDWLNLDQSSNYPGGRVFEAKYGFTVYPNS